MKSGAVALLLFSATVVAQTPAVSVAGKWKIHTSMFQESDSTCTFTQKGTDISGACEGDNGKFSAVGKVDGKKVTWSFKTEYNGSPLTVSYSGTLDTDSKMTGTTAVTEMSLDGQFTASKDTTAAH